MMGSILKASRPISWVNTAYPFAAAYLMVAHRIDAVFLVGTLFFLIPYNLLMYGVNDVFDYESDLANPRKGGIEGDVIRDRERARRLYGLVLTGAGLTGGSVLAGVGRVPRVGDGQPRLWRRAGVLPVTYAASVARFMHVSDDTCEDANRGWRTFLWLNQPVGFLVTILLILIYQGWGATPSFGWA